MYFTEAGGDPFEVARQNLMLFATLVGAAGALAGVFRRLPFAYGAYVVKLREEFGWSKTMLSAAFAMARAESGIFGPLQGWMTDRFGPRVLIRIGMSIFGIGFILFSFVGGPVTFFLTFFVMAVGSSLGGQVAVELTARRPDLVDRLIVLAPSGFA